MSDEVKELTTEQRSAITKLGNKYMGLSLLTGIHHGAMALCMNVILMMIVKIYMDGSEVITVLGAIAVGIFVVRRMSRINRERFAQLDEEIKAILAQK